jgi:hypothetical protein
LFHGVQSIQKTTNAKLKLKFAYYAETHRMTSQTDAAKGFKKSIQQVLSVTSQGLAAISGTFQGIMDLFIHKE